MCCIFTCCGWMIDLVQRLWTFTMSCCISSAVCCLMVTGSMSGIALGYNYSLAEYIDLKATNVSVYLKRGVFDDEIADDMDWRRSGRMPVAGHIGADNLRTGAPAEDDSTPLQSGRRLEDSVFESDDPNKYEGSLMRLTAQPLYPGTTTGTTEGAEYVQSGSNFLPGSLDQLKAIQGMINARKSAMGNFGTQQKTTYPDIDERYLAQLPPNPNLPPSGRRMMQSPNMVDRLNPARLAVPPQSIGSKENWIYPKDPGKYRKQFSYSDVDYPDFKPQYPKPIRLPTAPIRPPKPTPTPEMRTYRPEHEDLTTPRIPLISIKPDIDSAFKSFKEKMMLEKYEAPVRDYPKRPKDSSDDYDEDVKGLPVRRKRYIKRDYCMISKTVKTTKSDSTPSKITDNGKILNGNVAYDDVSKGKEHSTILYEDPKITKKHDTMKTLVDDKMEITATESLLPHKLLLKLTSKRNSSNLRSEENHNENNAKSGQNTSHGLSGKEEYNNFDANFESEEAISNAAKILRSIDISVSDIKPSEMVRILQYTVA